MKTASKVRLRRLPIETRRAIARSFAANALVLKLAEAAAAGQGARRGEGKHTGAGQRIARGAGRSRASNSSARTGPTWYQ